MAGTQQGLASVVVLCESVDLPRLASALGSLRQDRHAFCEILLVPVGDATPGVRAAVADIADPRVRVLPAQPTWQDAANTGADQAAGRFLRFARACDVHRTDALADLVGAVAASGSDLAIGGVDQRGRPAVWLERTSQALRASAGTARPVARTPTVAGDLGLSNKLFRTGAWRAAGCRLGALDRWLLAPAVARYLREAHTIDVLDRAVVEHVGGHGLRAFGATPNWLRDLPAWSAAAEEVDRLLHGTQLHSGWRGHVLDVALPGFLRDTERADDTQWADLCGLVARWTSGEDPDPALVRAESRTLLWLTGRGSRQEVARLCEELHVLGDDVPTALAGDHLSARWASLPADVPDHVRRLSEAETPLVVAVRRLGEADGPSRPVEFFCRVVQADLPATAYDVTVLDAAGSRIRTQVSEAAAATRWAGSALHRAIAVRADVPVHSGPLRFRLRLGDLEREAEVEVVEPHRRPADPDPLVVHDLVLDGTDLVVTVDGPGRLRLLDDRGREVGSADASSTRIQLRDELFGRERWLPTGHYRLVTPHGPATLTDGLVARLPLEQVGPRHRLHATVGPAGGLLLHLGAPLADDEQGRYAQHHLVSTYRDDDTLLDRSLVYFESYGGRTATDSPRAIHDELVARRPDLTTCWGVLDHAQEVPEGATPVLLRSREWYRLLARTGALVVNTDMEPWLRRRPGQVLMQTFHGYPSKGMGLGQWQAAELPPSRIAEHRARGVDNWSIILTPAPEMTRHYREQYAYAGPAVEHGYPRNDALVSQDSASRRQQTRSLLGLRDDQTAVLYAPTWRENLAVRPRRAEMTELLDAAAAARALGDDHVILVRGHRFHRPADTSPGVVDVTEYPEINDLLLAADVVVLDYSSLRFDAALTGSPMVFLVPDLADYAGGTRSFLFPFEDSAPGPFVQDTAGVVEQVRDVRALRDRWAPEIGRFISTYQKWQDGSSAERAVDALLQVMDQA